jgi:hypothetical protein
MDLKKFARLKLRGKRVVPESESPTPKEDPKPVAPAPPPPGMSSSPPTRVIPTEWYHKAAAAFRKLVPKKGLKKKVARMDPSDPF